MIGNLMLQCATKLSKQDMKNVKGGISAEEYCSRLRMIVEMRTIDQEPMTYGECQGANHGAREANCGFTFICD